VEDEEEAPPAIFAALRHRRRRLRVFLGLGAALLLAVAAAVIIQAYTNEFLADDIRRVLAEASFAALAGLVVLYGLYWHLRLRGGVPCPACGFRIRSSALASGLFAFCPDCGTRIAPGLGSPNRFVDRVALQAEGTCGYCGTPARARDAYCPACGANVGKTLFHTDALIASMVVISQRGQVQANVLRLGCFALMGLLLALPIGWVWSGRYFAPGAARIAGQALWVTVWIYLLCRAAVAYARAVEIPTNICPACARDFYGMTGVKATWTYCPACGWTLATREAGATRPPPTAVP